MQRQVNALRELLDAASRRIIDILDILITQEDWITIGELSSMMGASERTIAKDVDVIRGRWGQFLKVEASPNKGIRIHSRNVSALGRVVIDIFNDSTALRWLEEIFFNPGKEIEFFVEKLFVSRSTLIRALPGINRFLSERGMAIRYKGNRYQLIAEDEAYLRYFCAGFMIELYGLHPEQFDIGEDFDLAGSLLIKTLRQHLSREEADIVISDEIAILYCTMLYIVSLIRENQGYTIPACHNVNQEIDAEIMSGITCRFPKISKANLSAIDQMVIKQYCGWDSEEERALVEKQGEAFWKRIFGRLEAQLDGGMLRKLVFYIKATYLITKCRPYETSSWFDRIRYFSIFLKKHNDSAYALVERNLDILSQNVGLDLSGRMQDILFWLCLTYPEFCNYTQIKSALVISDFGTQHANYLARYIAAFINKKGSPEVRVEAAGCRVLQEPALAEEYDVIITTIPDLPIAHKNIILINDYPSHENLGDIYRSLG